MEEIGERFHQLSLRDQQILYYRYIADMGDEDIAHLLQTKAGNIRTYLLRAKKRFRNLLDWRDHDG